MSELYHFRIIPGRTLVTIEKAIRLAEQVAEVSRDWVEVASYIFTPKCILPKYFCHVSFDVIGGCSTYLPSSMESVVSGKSPGSAASITAGKDTRITR